MSAVSIVLLVLILLAFGGGQYIDQGAYRGPSFGIGGLLILVLVFLLIFG